jgi:hypothetical protein
VVVVISLLAVLALYLSGTPLLSLLSSQTESSPSGSFTVSVIQVHSPLLALCAAGLVGLITAVWPQRRPPKLQS